MDIFSYLLGRKYKDSNTGSGSGANITSNIKIVDNKSSVLSSNHNKLCIVNDTSDLSLKVVDKIDGGSEELSTLSEVLPQALYSACCAIYNEYIYIFGGFSGSYLNTIYEFNCTNRTINALSVTLPKPSINACCATHGDNIYIFGGYYYEDGNKALNTIYKFNCVTKTIETLSATLPLSVSGTCCTVHNDVIYIFGGSLNGYWNNIYKFNCTTETISKLSVTLPQALAYACCAPYGDNIYIFGGRNKNYLNTIYKFNCNNETTSTLSVTLPQALHSACCAPYGNNIYIFGGNNNGSFLNTICKFNCTAETINALSVTLTQGVNNACCSISGSNIYVFGGNNNSILNTIYKFSVTFDLTANNVLLYCANSKFNFGLITDQVTIPIKNIYIGDSNNTAQLCNAYLYDETKSAWVNVNTGEVLTA